MAPSCDLPFLGLSYTSIKWIDCALLPPPPQAYRTYICGKQGAVFAQTVYSHTKKQIELGAFGESMYCTVFFLFLFLIQGFLRQFVASPLFSLPLLELPSTSFPPSFFVTRHKKLLLQKKEERKTIRRSSVETEQKSSRSRTIITVLRDSPLFFLPSFLPLLY